MAAACLSALERVVHRLNLAGQDDTRGYALTFQATCALLSLPLLAVVAPSLVWPSPSILAAMAGAAVCWAAFSILTFKADSLLETSVKAGVSRLRLIWTLALGVIVFSESLSLLKALGVFMIACAPLLLVVRNRTISRPGLSFEIASTLALAGALAFDKVCLQELPATAVTFFSFATAAVLTFALRGAGPVVANSWLSAPRFARVATAAALSVACYLALMTALAAGELSRVAPIYMLGPLLSTILGIVLLRERSDAAIKIAVAVVAAVGGYLTTLK